MRLLPALLFAACGGSHASPPPVVSVGEPTTIAPYDQHAIQTTVDAHRDAIRACYEHALATRPGLAGKVEASFVIGRDGAVLQASATGLDPDVAACIASAIRALTFPAPQGGVVSVDYPFELAPSDGGTPLLSRKNVIVLNGIVDERSGSGSGSSGSGSDDDSKAAIDKSMTMHRGVLVACYQKALQVHPGLAGKAVATFTVGADGAVTDASVQGVDPDLDACIEKQIRAIKFPAPAAGSVNVSYPFVFASS